MSNPNGRKGSLWETTVLKYLRDKGLLAERLAKAGASDEGDLVCFVSGKPYVLELKNTQRMDLPKFWREATTEATNYAKARGLDEAPPAYVIVKRRNAAAGDGWVVQTLDQWVQQ